MVTKKTHRFVLTLVTVGLLWAALSLLQVVRADSGTLFVAPGGSGSACSQSQPCLLQEALNKAVDRDTIYLAAGTYTGRGSAVITITKSITVYCGWDGNALGQPLRDPARYVSVIDGQGQRRGVYIFGPVRPTVDGCTITRGNASNGPDPGIGGGLYSLLATPIIANNVVTGNVAYTSTTRSAMGGGMYVGSAGLGAAILGNHIAYNVASTSYAGSGGGLWVCTCPWITVAGNWVLHNTASATGGVGYGGGIGMGSSTYALVDNNVIESNVAQGGPATAAGSWGGGLYAGACGGMTMTNNLLRGNTASIPATGQGGGACLDACDGAKVAGNRLEGNVGCASTSSAGAGRGGGFSTYASRRVAISANRVLSNTASLNAWGYGGGFYFSRNSSFTMTNNIVAANHASFVGGAVAFETGATQPVTGTLVHNTVVGNDRGAGDGRIGIHLNKGWVTLAMTNNIISRHTYGVYAVAGSTVTLRSTLFYANTSGDTGGPGRITNTAALTGQDPLLNVNYHLSSGSPAIDAGVNAGVTTDIDGDPRPTGAGYDIGADEAQPSRRLYLPVLLRNLAS